MKDPANMKVLRAEGVIICLTAGVDVILERTDRRGSRPLLDNAEDDRRGEIERLLAERRELYKEADYTIDTDDMSPLQVAEEALKFYRRAV